MATECTIRKNSTSSLRCCRKGAKISDGTYLKYSKKKLNPNYLSEKIRNAILNSEIMKGVKLFIRG